MKKQKRNQNQFNPILAIIVTGLALILIILSVKNPKKGLPGSEKSETQQSTSASVINNQSDLNSAASELDKTDLGQFDEELKRLDSDLSTF